jgi:hypothetical protein
MSVRLVMIIHVRSLPISFQFVTSLRAFAFSDETTRLILTPPHPEIDIRKKWRDCQKIMTQFVFGLGGLTVRFPPQMKEKEK